MSASASTLSTVDSTPRPSGFLSRWSLVLPTSFQPPVTDGKHWLAIQTYIFYPAGSVKSEFSRHPLPPWSELTVVAALEHSVLVYHIRLWMQAEWRKASPTAASRQVPYTLLLPWSPRRYFKLPQKSSGLHWLVLQSGDGRSFKRISGLVELLLIAQRRTDHLI